MWTKKLRSTPPEARALLTRVRTHGWKSDAERDDLLRRIAAIENLDPEEVGWMVANADAAVRQSGVALLQRHPFESASAAMFPFLAGHGDAARRNVAASLEAVAGASFATHVPSLLAHPDPVVNLAALDWLMRNPSDAALQAIVPALASPSPQVRRKAFTIVEATPSKKAITAARAAIDHDDEEIRFRAVGVLARVPDEANIPALLRRCHADSERVQDAAIAALTPVLGAAMAGGQGEERFHEYILPLLTDANEKVRGLAMKILETQEPERVADAFLNGFCDSFGPARDRAIEGLKALGPPFIHAFLSRDNDPDPAIAALAGSIAVNLRSPEVVPHCVRFIEGSDWWLRDRAAQALAELRDERGMPALLKMLQDPDSDISAAAALGAWGSPAALPALLEAFKRGTKDLRLEILEAFSRIPDPRVGPLLDQIARMINDPLVHDKALRLIAAREGREAPSPHTGPSPAFVPLDFEANPRPTLRELLRHARAAGASDLHLAAGTRPHLRRNGRLEALPLAEVDEGGMWEWLPPILGDRSEELERSRQVDFCYKDPELGRFRTNVFHQRKGLNAVFRLVPFEIPTLADVALPESVWEITTLSQGLILVTGPAGCGKTTTLAALVDRINETERSHILTIEDPIEYVHTNKESLVNQREIPTHSKSFAKALRQSLREDPDVILVGEMRDLETISLAITASETGHLVLGTLHTTTASSTVDRVINAFPAEQQGQIRMMISDSLKAVLSQTLLPRRDGSGRIAAFEVLRNTPNVAGLIRDGKTFQLPTAMQTGAAAGMTLMDTALMNLVTEGMIEARVAQRRALRKDAFEHLLPEEGGAA
ncbi:MAG TPA: PilT/PilU family type 4a pilus ATPase [Thermoanaerobaculia bacterium]|nr:PilT/PilU family type 4a pilus ATPase [Thermoanaerobaculia bacterium]